MADVPKGFHSLPDTARVFLTDYLIAYDLKDVKVDLIFFNGSPFGLSSRLLKPAKSIADVPAHNIELSVEEYERRNGAESYPFDHMIDPFLWNIYSHHIKSASVVLCPSRASAQYILKKLDLRNRVEVIPHGCDIPEAAKVCLPAEFTVVHIGANAPDKGQIYLVKALHMLRHNPRFAASLVMVGYGTRLWFPFGVFCFEHVVDIGKIYSECSVYVQPSVTEGFGLPALEAMAHARPVIVTEGAGVSDLVEDGKEGFVVPIRNPCAIAEKIEYLYSNPDEAKRMGRNARKKAEEYTWKIIEGRYRKLIQDVLNEHS